MTGVFSLVAALVALGLTAPAAANVFGADNRHVVAPVGQGHATAIVGSILTNAPVPDADHPARLVMTGATAFMVSPCHALTNFHAVFGRADHGDRTHTVTMTIVGSKTYKVVGTPVVWGSLVDGQDWALLKVTCVGLDPLIGWGIPAGPYAPADVQMTGFPGDKDRSRPWTSRCRIHGILNIAGASSRDGSWVSDNFVLHDCAAYHGSSGSPIYTTDVTGIPQIVAVNTATAKHVPGVIKAYSDGRSNRALLYFDIMFNIQSYLDDAIGHFGVENPQIALAKLHDTGLAGAGVGFLADDLRSRPLDVVQPRDCPWGFDACLD